MKVIAGVYSGVTTVELDTLAAETAASLTTKHPDYAILAATIAVSNRHKETEKVFSGKYNNYEGRKEGGREGGRREILYQKYIIQNNNCPASSLNIKECYILPKAARIWSASGLRSISVSTSISVSHDFDLPLPSNHLVRISRTIAGASLWYCCVSPLVMMPEPSSKMKLPNLVYFSIFCVISMDGFPFGWGSFSRVLMSNTRFPKYRLMKMKGEMGVVINLPP